MIQIPNVPQGIEPSVNRWANDLVNYLQSLQSFVNNVSTLPQVAYANVANLRPVKGQMVIVPDHPDGYSILIFDGTVFNRFTAAGVL